MNLTKEELNTLDNALIEYNIYVDTELFNPRINPVWKKSMERDLVVLGSLLNKVSAAMIAAQNEDHGAFRSDGGPLTVTAENLPDGLDVKGSGIRGRGRQHVSLCNFCCNLRDAGREKAGCAAAMTYYRRRIAQILMCIFNQHDTGTQ